MDLLPLTTPLEEIPSVQKRFLPKLKRLGIETVRDLLWHFPTRYEDWSEISPIAELKIGDEKTVQGLVQSVRSTFIPRRRILVTEATVADESGTIKAVWFNQPYITQSLKEGRRVSIAGKVKHGKKGVHLSSPVHELLDTRNGGTTRHTARIVPVYPETRGITSRGIRFILQPILESIETIPEFIPEEILEELKLPEINKALRDIHMPEKIEETERAKERFAFQDLFLLQLKNVTEKLALQKQTAPAVKCDKTALQKLLKQLPFKFTDSQDTSLKEILENVSEPHPMNRLLQGDVGSGKTIVAGITAIIAGSKPNNVQTAFMAPTEILSRQHYKTLTALFDGFTGGIGLLVAKEARVFHGDGLEDKTTRKKLLDAVANGKVKILIGTHTLIQKSVKFNRLGLVVIDEQHRFGVKQRAMLAVRGQAQTETRTNTDELLLYEDLTYKIRGSVFEVKKQIGLGHKETVYQKALAEELHKRGVKFESEKIINISYKNKKVGTYQPDFVVDGKVIVELKALSYVGEAHQKQVWSYLKGSPYKLALLINFGSKDVEMKRIVYDTARGPRGSASSPRESVLVPHFLSMSATPIPRTLMMTVFGNLDISLITELPAGRRKIITKIVDPKNRDKAYAFIRGEVRKGRQVYVVCPRIETPAQNGAEDTRANAEIPHTSASSPHQSAVDRRSTVWDDVKAVEDEYQKLSKKVFPDLRVSMIHGKLKSKEKDSIMRAFSDGKSDVLVSTSVIEVGVDIPNSTIIMIENAERFGLAQLYQFRGRVGRGEHQSFCFLFTDSHTPTVHKRLESLLTAKNSFELAEKDLEIRGPGEFLGTSQSGLPDIAMKAIQNPKLLKSAQQKALEIIEKDQTLKSYPALRKQLEMFGDKIHLE